MNEEDACAERIHRVKRTHGFARIGWGGFFPTTSYGRCPSSQLNVPCGTNPPKQECEHRTSNTEHRSEEDAKRTHERSCQWSVVSCQQSKESECTERTHRSSCESPP